MTHRKHRIEGSTTRRDMLRMAGGAAALSALPLGSALAAPYVQIAQAVKKIRFAHAAPTAHGWHLWAEQFKKSIEAKTDGKVEVQIFPNAQMGNERDTAQAVRIGSLEMGAIGVGLMNWVPEMSVTDAPFLWKSRAQAHRAIEGAFGDDLRKRCLDKGFVLTGWTDLGFRSMTNNKQPINSAKDMASLKMRVPPSKSYIAMMQALGSSTVTVDLSELYLALRQGVADGQETPTAVTKSNKYYEVQKYISKTDHILTIAYTVMNPDAFKKLSADEQKAVVASGKEADAWLRGNIEKEELEVFNFLKAQGMQANLTPDVESFRVATTPVIEKMPDLFLPELVKIARATPA